MPHMQFLENIVSLNLKDYGGADLPIGLILLCAFLGMIFATIVIQYTNALIYRTVKALMRHKAIDPESAKDLKALGLSDHKRILFALWHENSMLMRFLAAAPKDEPAEAEKASEEAKTSDEPPAEKAENKAPEKKITTKDRRKEKTEALLATRYYLSPTYADRAKEILSGSEDTLWHTVGYCALFVLLFIGLAWLLPMILPIIM